MADEPLATEADLVAVVGALSTEQQARVAGLLASASTAVREAAGQQFTITLHDVVRLRPQRTARGWNLVLPKRPVHEVHAVMDLAAGAEVAASVWAWDGLDRVTLSGAPAASYQVTYTHGYYEPPTIVRDTVVNAVNRVLTAPTMADGVTSETIGQYSVQTAGGRSGSQVRLTHEERDLLRRRFRRQSTTVYASGPA